MSATTVMGSIKIPAKATQFASDKLRMAQALKATNAVTNKATAARQAASAYTKVHPRQGGSLAVLVLGSPAFYHASVKGAVYAVKAASATVSGSVHLASRLVGTIGSLAAKAVSVVFPLGGRVVQRLTWHTTQVITNVALRIEDVTEFTTSVTYSVLVSPTVTKAVTSTANYSGLLMFFQLITRSRAAMWLSRIPFVGPYLAAIALGGAAVYSAIHLALAASVVKGLVMRPEELLAVHRGLVPAPSFRDEFRREFLWWKSVKEVIAEAEQILVDSSVEESMLDEPIADVIPIVPAEASEAAEDVAEALAAQEMLAEADGLVKAERPRSASQPKQRNRSNRNNRKKAA